MKNEFFSKMKRGRWEYDRAKPLKAFDWIYYDAVANDNDNAFDLIEMPDFDDSTPGVLGPWTLPEGRSISVYRITGEVRIDDNSAQGWNVSDHDVFGTCSLIVDHKNPFNAVQYFTPKYDDVFMLSNESGAPRVFGNRVTSTEINLQNADRYEVLFAHKLLLGPIVESFNTKMPFNGATDNYDQSSEDYCGFFNWRRPIYYPAAGNGSISAEDPLFEPWRHPASKLIKRYNAEPINFGVPTDLVNLQVAKGPLRPQLAANSIVPEVGEYQETSFSGNQQGARAHHCVGLRHPNLIEAGGTLGGFLCDSVYEVPAPYLPVEPGQTAGHFDGQIFGVATLGQSKHVILLDRDETTNPNDQAQLAPMVTHVENVIHKQGLGMRIAATTQLNASKRMVDHDHDFKTIDIDCSDNPLILNRVSRNGNHAFTSRLYFGRRSDSVGGRYVDGMVLRVALRFWYEDLSEQ